MDSLEQAFAKHLRDRRRELGMTQEQLGELINYSEKSVSKWEQGASLPGVDVLVRLSRVLSVDINQLLRSESEPLYYLGIDGGATKTSFALTNEYGCTIKSLRLGACNPFDKGMKESQDILERGIREICAGIPLGNVAMFAGISGGVSGGNKAIFNSFFRKFGFFRFGCGGDMESAVALALTDRDGIAVIIGTGSVICAVKDGVQHRVGGYGYLFDQALSGYEIGRAGISAALSAADGSGEKTRIAQLLEEELGGTVSEKLNNFYSGGKTYIASFAPVIFRAQREGDAVADAIVREKTEALCRQIGTAMKLFDGKSVPVVFVGGITEHEDRLVPLIQSLLGEKAEVSFCRKEPVEGALYLSGKECV